MGSLTPPIILSGPALPEKRGTNAENFCQKMLYCCTTMAVQIYLLTLFERFRNSTLENWLILSIVLTFPNRISTCFVHLKKH
ncbi:hypothetical protein LAZ67_13001303 [Cordylochernes scorpioides]|uniref:Uncharacterized protein n=1 Tax=Cordylochernes scorpioides TaxID=51811 RepID=A0ABY6L3Q6_9ARAC|nr:hypothetical protein LAZ67_13001303 [Cordylochernes scorpioides]